MSQTTTRRLLAGPLLVAALGAGLALAPAAANAAAANAAFASAAAANAAFASAAFPSAAASIAGVPGTVAVSGTLKVRSAPSLSAPIVGSVGNGRRVTVQCSVTGTPVRGRGGTTRQWDRLSTGHYLSHAYVRTRAAVRACPASSPEAVPVGRRPASTPARSTYKIGTIASTDGSVNLRALPSTAAAITGTLPSGAHVALVCGVVGTPVSGTVRTTTQWDRTTAGAYVSHAYVITPTLTLCRGGNALPRPTPSLTSQQFVAAAAPAAQLGWRQYGVPPSVTIAQAILESGWGRSGLSTVDRNYFGIKCFNGRFGTLATGCHTYRTSECTAAGRCFATSASFRIYPTMTNSFRDHGNFLRVNSRYAGAFTYTRDANRFIWAVWKAGYATDPDYYTKITSIMAANDLYRYDTWA